MLNGGLGRSWAGAHLVACGKLEPHLLRDGGRRAIRTRLVALLLAELCPLFALRDGMLDDGFLQNSSCFAGDLSATVSLDEHEACNLQAP